MGVNFLEAGLVMLLILLAKWVVTGVGWRGGRRGGCSSGKSSPAGGRPPGKDVNGTNLARLSMIERRYTRGALPKPQRADQGSVTLDCQLLQRLNQPRWVVA